MNSIDKLFNPNYTFVGNPESILKDYPNRSKHLESYSNNSVNAKNINSKFIKDGYVYLLRGAKSGQESGFYSKEYANKCTIESLKLDPVKVAFAHAMNGNTPFISATTDLYVAASFSKKERIYVIKISVDDVYTFYQDEMLMEEEYMIPDFISSNETIRSFRYDKFKQIYNFLINEVGLNLIPEDIGVSIDDLKIPDIDKINSYIDFNEIGANQYDPLLNAIQESIINSSEHISLQNDKPYMLTKKII